MRYHYECERSALPEHQVPGMRCEVAQIGGEISAQDAAEAWDFVLKLPCVSGVWLCKLRRGNKWLKPYWVRVKRDLSPVYSREPFAKY